MEQIVLEALRELGGKGTAYQVERHIGIDSNTITPRFKPLEAKGLIERTDERGPGRGTRSQIVWRVLTA